MMKLEIVSKETIKPLSPTPPELRNLPLCLFDQQAPNIYIEILYFYGSNHVDSGHRRRLKDTLSRALTFYYPFAGRLNDGCNAVDCNDMGATFSEAKFACPMSEFMNALNSQRHEIAKLICLDHMIEKDSRSNPLLSIQLTQFECGGEVMFVVCSHKVADMASLTNFMNDWATIARTSGGSDPRLLSPQFNMVGFFQRESDEGSEPSGGKGSGSKREEEDVCSMRLVFEGSKIAALKAMVSEKVENPSRVQILTAFLYKAMLFAKNSVKVILESNEKMLEMSFSLSPLVVICPTYQGGLPPTSLLQLINLRTRVEPPLPKTFIGNIISFYIASTTASEQRELELWNVVGDMKKNFEEYCNKFPKDYIAEEWGSLYKLHAQESLEKFRNPSDCVFYTCTSWCKFPIYDADFGWGKPVWVTPPAFPPKNLIVLIDAKDGEGVDAIVCLEKEEMAVFEQNEELLSFCELKSFPQKLSS